jgi:hypothetical protein
VPLVALFARRVVGRAAGLFAALVVAVHPAHVAASQTADPVVVAVSAALLAGVLAGARWWWPAVLAVVFAGACHPVGWLLAPALALGARPAVSAFLLQPLVSVRRWLVGAAAAVLVVLIATNGAAVALELRLPALALAVAGVFLLPRTGVGIALAIVLPLGAGALTSLLGFGGIAAGALAALPATAMLAAVAVVRLAGWLRALPVRPPWLLRMVALLPGLVLLTECAVTLFLYFTLFFGGRAPWRDAARRALGTMQVGTGLYVLAGEGASMLRCYLRPDHFREAGVDAHPAVVVEALPLADPARVAERLAAADGAGVVLILLEEEQTALLRDPLASEALRPFELIDLLPCPQPDGNAAIGVLQRPAAR